MDENGEVLFKIPAKTSKLLKPGSFYTFAVLADAYNKKSSTVYKRLTENGNVLIEYGTQDMLVKTDSDFIGDIVAAKLVTPDTPIDPVENPQTGEILEGRLEITEEI
jgi:hypothetical protein